MIFLLLLLVFYISIVWYLNYDLCDVYFWIDDIVSIGMFFVVVLFVLVVMVGWIGILVEDSDFFESFVGFDVFIFEDGVVVGVIEFVLVFFILKVMWLWLNLLLK